jgi:hypothetical protein
LLADLALITALTTAPMLRNKFIVRSIDYIGKTMMKKLSHCVKIKAMH